MSQISENNKRIAKNTLLLYFRMLFLMLISLYTSRVVLKALGVEDYGIYNVVGGFVSLFAVISRSLSSASSRFLNYEMGKGNYEKLKKIFSISVSIQILLAIIILILCETIGLWFLNNKMTIPNERIVAANWTYQFSVLTFCSTLIVIPYNAAIIAHERMKAFAYTSLIEGIAKLIIAFLIIMSPIDSLTYYAILMCILQLALQAIYKRYCVKRFQECKYTFIYDSKIVKEMFGYAGWNFIGASASVLQNQGGNVILNMFFNPSVNAAKAIANQVLHAIQGFATNFVTALNPQITKNYANGNIVYMMRLAYEGSRLSYYMLLLLSLPVVFNCNYLLSIWLGEVPVYANIFVVLTLVNAMIDAVSQPLITMQQATGKVKNYQIIVGGILLLNIPLSYISCFYGSPPESVFYISILIAIVCLIARILILRMNIKLDVIRFAKSVLLRIVIVTIISIIPPLCLAHIFHDENFLLFSINSAICMISVCGSVFLVGLTEEEKAFVLKNTHKLFKKLKK